MTQLTLSRLVSALGPSQVTGFFLVLARVAPLFVLAPLFSSKMIPTRARAVVAVAIAAGLTAVATHGATLPADPMDVAGLLVVQLLCGLAFAFAVGVVFAAVETAGSLIDTVAGFSYGSLVDPVNGNPGGVLTNLYGLIGTAMFIAVGGDAWVLRGLARTFSLVPLTHGLRVGSLAAGVQSAAAGLFVSALEVAAPALLALFITDVSFGIVSRVVPQLNVFAVGFPLKVGVALLIVAASLPFLGGWMSSSLAGAVGSSLASLGR